MVGIRSLSKNKRETYAVKSGEHRGASRTDKRKRNGAVFNKFKVISISSFDLQKIIYLTFFLSLLAAFYASFLTVETVLGVAVEKVNIKGELIYQNKADISHIINSYTADGFFAVDLSLLHSQLLALPWIYQVSIQRQLPDGLQITLVEEKVVAKWNENAFITQYGEVIRPVEKVSIEGLVAFTGIKHKEVLDLYKRVSKLLPDEQLPIVAMQLDQRNVLSIELVAGAVLVLNADSLDEQLARWKQIVSGAVQDQLAGIRQADLRYSNGAAVAWKNHVVFSNNVH